MDPKNITVMVCQETSLRKALRSMVYRLQENGPHDPDDDDDDDDDDD
jgi:hypothetical protein